MSPAVHGGGAEGSPSEVGHKKSLVGPGPATQGAHRGRPRQLVQKVAPWTTAQVGTKHNRSPNRPCMPIAQSLPVHLDCGRRGLLGWALLGLGLVLSINASPICTPWMYGWKLRTRMCWCQQSRCTVLGL